MEIVNCILKRPRTRFCFCRTRVCCRLTVLLAIVRCLIKGSRYSRYIHIVLPVRPFMCPGNESYLKFMGFRRLNRPTSSSWVICQTTGPKLLPKRFLHIVRSRASSFDWQYPLLSLRSSSSFLCLLPRLLVTSICPFIFPSIICYRRQFLRKMWPIQLAFRFLISCRIFLCTLILSNTCSFLTWSVQLIFSILLQHHVSKLSRRWAKNTLIKLPCCIKLAFQIISTLCKCWVQGFVGGK